MKRRDEHSQLLLGDVLQFVDEEDRRCIRLLRCLASGLEKCGEILLEIAVVRRSMRAIYGLIWRITRSA
jgi:hypothetical protein